MAETDMVRTGFGATELEQRHETASTAAAERAKAEVQARCIVAMQCPRNLQQTRVRILEHCKRRRFAEEARYSKPIAGTKIVGPSIRFVEAALQEYGNCQSDAPILYEDDTKIICRVAVVDFERNVTHSQDISVTKTVERKSLRQGQKAISQRANSYGETVFLVAATDDDIENKKGALTSKAIRNLGLRILPADIVAEAMDVVVDTLSSRCTEDPDSQRKKIADEFYRIGIAPKDLEEYLGHAMEQTTPAELVELRVTFATLRAGEATWTDALEYKLRERGDGKKRASKGAKALKEQLEARSKTSEAKKRTGTHEGKTPGGEEGEDAKGRGE